MKSQIFKAFGIGTAAALLIALPVVAIDAATTTTEKTTLTAEQRIAAYKEQFKLKLTAAQQTRLKTRCKAAQIVLKTSNDASTVSLAARSKAYDTLDSELTKIITKLTAAGTDASQLKTEQAALQAKVATFKTDITSYQAQVADANAIDCVTDPTGFKSALEAARASRINLAKELDDIRAYVTSTIKPTLATLRQTVAAKSTATSTTQGGNQ